MFFFFYFVITPVMLILTKILTGRHPDPILIDVAYGFFAICVLLKIIYSGRVRNFRNNKILIFLIMLFIAVLLVKILLQGFVFNILSLMELKILYYLTITLIIISRNSYNIDKIEPFFSFFSLLYIAYAVALVVGHGYLKKTGIFSESNYDGFLILMGYIFLISKEGVAKKSVILPKIVLYWFATFLTFSLTGLISLFCITLTYFIRNKRIYGLFCIVLFLCMLFPFMPNKIKNIENSDRVLFWNVGLKNLGNASRENFLIGFPLGKELPTNDLRMIYYMERQSFPKGGYGLFPFNFHAYHLRFLLGYGFLASLFFYLIIYKQIKKEIWGPYLMILILIQGFSMGVFFITVIAIPLFLVIFGKDYPAYNCSP